MKQCPRCYSPNNEASQYCESCGTLLRASESNYPTATPQRQQQAHVEPVQYPVPKPIHVAVSTPSSYPSYTPTQLPFGGKIRYNTVGERKRSGIGMTFGILLYVMGAALSAFGLSACFMPLHNDTLLAIMFILGLLASLVVLVFILILHRLPLLRGWLRVILSIGASVPAAAMLIATFAVSSAGQSQTTNGQYVAMGIICLLYGISLETIALI